MKSSSIKAKFQMGQFKSLKLIVCKLFQSELEGQGQGRQFLKLEKVF